MLKKVISKKTFWIIICVFSLLILFNPASENSSSAVPREVASSKKVKLRSFSKKKRASLYVQIAHSTCAHWKKHKYYVKYEKCLEKEFNRVTKITELKQ